MTAIAQNEPITRGLPNNQVSTMQAYPMPSYPMPQQQAILDARSRSPSPLYSDPSQLDASRYNALLARGGGASPGLDGLASSVGALAPSAGIPGDPRGAMDAMGPDTQTAPGGVMGAGSNDFTTPGAWSDFFTARNMRGTRAGPPPTVPPVMAGSRTATAQPWAPGQTAWQPGRGLAGLQPPAPVPATA